MKKTKNILALEPLYDRLIVKRIDVTEEKKGMLFIPEVAKEKPMVGIVVAVGEGRVREDGTCIPLRVKVKDKVMFGKYGGTELRIEDIEHVILREDEVLAILRG